MFGRTASAYVLLALGLTAAPALAQDGTIYDEWANFYDDTECSVNGGISVSLNNDGCLNQRKSREDSPSSDIASLELILYSDPVVGTHPELSACAYCVDLVDVYLL